MTDEQRRRICRGDAACAAELPVIRAFNRGRLFPTVSAGFPDRSFRERRSYVGESFS